MGGLDGSKKGSWLEILGDAHMGMRATAAGCRTRELGRAKLGLNIFSPFQTRIKIH